MVKCFTLSALILGLVVALVGPSYATSSGSGGPTPASYTCTFGPTPGTPPILADTGTNGAGNPDNCCKLVNVSRGKCFNLTDVSAATNNGARRLNIDSGIAGSATECAGAKELFVWQEGGADAGTATQDFVTGLFFSGGSDSGIDVLATSDNNNNNVTVSISGLWVPCPNNFH